MPNLENYKEFKMDYAGQELVVEIGKYAEQAKEAIKDWLKLMQNLNK